MATPPPEQPLDRQCGKRYLNWELDDPASKSVAQIRPIRDDIDRRIQDLLTELVPAGT